MAKGKPQRFSTAMLRGQLKDGLHTDAQTPGLAVHVRGGGRHRSFIWRGMRQGKLVSISIGPVAKVDLAKARDLARRYSGQLANGLIPIKQPLTVDTAVPMIPPRTFRDDTLAYYQHTHRTWVPAHAKIWMKSMELHVFPLIGDQTTSSLTTLDIVRVLSPAQHQGLWFEKPETASEFMVASVPYSNMPSPLPNSTVMPTLNSRVAMLRLAH